MFSSRIMGFSERISHWVFSEDCRVFSENPWVFSEDYRVFSENPWGFSEDHMVFSEDPWGFSEDTWFSVRTTRVYSENHRVFIKNH